MSNMTNTEADKFIPKLWSDDVVAEYKSRLVAASLVRNLSHAGKKGDSIYIPTPARVGANAKVAGQEVTLNTDTATNLTLSINEHWEWSMQIEDLTKLQALDSMRKFYTDQAGYALASAVDNKIITDLSGAATAATGATVEEKVLDGIETLNVADAPTVDRALMVSPATYTELLSNPRFSEADKVGGNAISTGNVGSIYGVTVYMTSAVASGGILLQKEALVLATQQSVRTQTQYKQEHLADLFTADTVFGTLVARPGSIVSIQQS